MVRGREIFLRKRCPSHGLFETVIWRGFLDFNEWTGGLPGNRTEEPPCNDACGLCPDHLQQTCCVILDITGRCNLECSVCFADPGRGREDPPLSAIRASLEKLVEKGKTLVQLSGGEPTVRDDLPEIVAAAKEVGAKYVQLNTNGLRLATDRELAGRLALAGLSFVFLQFDGTEEPIHQQIRNRPLLDIKRKVIERCADANLGVTLVPTLIRGVNTHNIGEIIRFAVDQSPAVRGVHFQPVTYLGRVTALPSDNDRFTLDELIREIVRQTEGIIAAPNLLPSCCDHPLCGFHGDFVVHNGNLVPLLAKKETSSACCCTPAPADKNREFVARRWQRPVGKEEGEVVTGDDLRDMEVFLHHVRNHGFTLTAMAFQDAGNIDLARLRHCSLHVYDDGRLVPFCSYFLTPWKDH